MNKEDVFVKPDEQNKACSGSAMERKDFHKMEPLLSTKIR